MTYIMTVDDSKIIRRIIKSTIEALGFETLEATDGLECLSQLQLYASETDLILMDWNMPNMDGYHALLSIKQDERTQHIPVMMVSTEGERNRMIEAIRAGASHYLTKPFTEEDLLTHIMECLPQQQFV
jgi:two-component system, chemotaxis family, chemotaxis protein CheY